MNMEGICETGPTVYRPYPRRLESLFADFLLSYFKTLSVGPAGVELTTSRMTTRCSTNEPPVRGGNNALLNDVLFRTEIVQLIEQSLLFRRAFKSVCDSWESLKSDIKSLTLGVRVVRA